MSDLLAIHLIVGGIIILCCALALRFRLVDIIFRRVEFEPEHIQFLNAVLWGVIAWLVFVIGRDIWRNIAA